MQAQQPSYVRIRPATSNDKAFLHKVAPRLLAGYAPWRDAGLMLATMDRFLQESLQAMPGNGMMFIAEESNGRHLGVVTVSRHQNFTGEPQAHVGELAVIEGMEGQGIGRLLMNAAEAWARDQGYNLVVLDTGAANSRARRFYAHLGYRGESVRLVKRLAPRVLEHSEPADSSNPSMAT